MIIGMSIGHEKRRLTLDAWKAKAEVISETIRNTTCAEQAVFMREFVMDRVDVIVVVYSDKVAESRVA